MPPPSFGFFAAGTGSKLPDQVLEVGRGHLALGQAAHQRLGAVPAGGDILHRGDGVGGLLMVHPLHIAEDAVAVLPGAEEAVLPYYGARGGWHRIYTGQVVEAYAR